MIPELDDRGLLPPGLHPATLAELDRCFGHQSDLRRIQVQSLTWMIDAARRAGVQRIVVNGSFVTDVIEPNDVDCLLLLGPTYPVDAVAEREIEQGFPFLELQLVDDRGYSFFVKRFFATDRDGVPKGMVEILL
ncbi:MAG: hypothetical protein KDA47_25355 [Planctomycetales bacterium]|nr:hypothetical protein [Planctomycetales bacterium]